MQSKQDLLNLIFDKYLYFKRLDCEGCQYNSGSQIRHQLCLSQDHRDFYFNKAIDWVFLRIALKSEEKILLEEIITEYCR